MSRTITTTVTISGTLYRVTGEVHQAIRGELSEPGAQRGEDEPGCAVLTKIRFKDGAGEEYVFRGDWVYGRFSDEEISQFESALLTAASEQLNEPNE